MTAPEKISEEFDNLREKAGTCGPHVRLQRRRAFSLIELLVVVAIIGLLAALIVPAVSGISRSYQMNAAGHAVLNTLMQARQTAMTRGYPVQVRLYKLPGYLEANTAAPSVFRAMQIFLEADPVVSGGGVTVPVTPLSKPVFFSSPVELLANQSSILTLPATTSPQETLAGFSKNYSYVSFRFKPSGQADLPATATGLTLALSTDPSGAGLPKNFRALEIDPATGAVRDYAP
jgi:uncharacterized protein (TIGR02596 family)